MGSASAMLARSFALCGLALLLCGCSTIGYYGQAVDGHMDIVRRQRPIEQVLRDPATTPELRASLETVLQLRSYAATNLSLPVDGHYLRYADLGRKFVVWNVHSAPEFSLTARTWWYPFVGRLKYRGYFLESRARRLAGRLAARGEDVYLGGVEAYSTLGWFRDPVLNTFIHHKAGDLAELLFHELAHQRVFISGDTDFNEAFATAVAQEGARRWLRAGGLAAELERYERHLRQEREFAAMVRDARAELASLYSGGGQGTDSTALRDRKAEVIARLRERHAAMKAAWGGKSRYEAWFAAPINNAKINTVATYYDLVPGFDALLRRCGGDLPRFYGEVARLGKSTAAVRRERLAEVVRSER